MASARDSIRKWAFISGFVLLVLITQRIDLAAVVGAEGQHFTLFQMVGPLAGAFLGPFLGIATVLGAEILDLGIFGTSFDLITILRLTPMLFAAYYFGTRRRNSGTVVPAVAMALFWLHPTGQQAWPYALYWVIPIGISFAGKKQNMFLRSLGATFTAHAVGSVLFLYAVPMDAGMWLALIPQVALERLLFASGIALSYLAAHALLDRVADLFGWRGFLRFDRRAFLPQPSYSRAGKR